jgi:hypothetical protein
MPTKRRFIIFLIVLALMLLIKRAVGQEPAVGWGCTYGGYEASLPDEVQSILFNSACTGILLGMGRVWARARAQQRGTYLFGDLVQLDLR